MGNTNGRVAVIFGGASGIGKAIAGRCLQTHGMICYIIDLDGEAINDTRKHFNNHKNLHLIRGDSTDELFVNKLAEDIFQKHKDGVFALFNNTGIARGYSTYQTPLPEWRKCMSVTFEANIISCNAFVPKMLQQQNKEAIIVTTSSLAGLLNSFWETGAPYTIAKHASRLFSEALSKELANTAIRVYCVCPGPVNTNLMKNSYKIGGEVKSFGFENNPNAINEQKLREGLSPDQVAQAVEDGIRNNRFYIVVPEERKDGVAAIMASVARDVLVGGKEPLSYQNPKEAKTFGTFFKNFIKTNKL